MSLISILIVDDDLNKIANIIKVIKSDFVEGISFSQASNVQEAIISLQENEFHLLITDLKMPLKFDDSPNDRGGESLLKSLYRKKSKVHVPMYIVALTQFTELQLAFKGLWKVLHYDGALEEWKTVLRDLVFHISFIKSRITSEKLPTVFLEGLSDKKICVRTLQHFEPSVLEKIFFDTINYGGGAAWVERKLFIWAKSLEVNAKNGKYIKCVGIFDNDDAGNTSVNRLRGQIPENSAEGETFSIVKNAYKYSPMLKSINSKGIKFPTTIEDLIGTSQWIHAKDNGWLQKRDLSLIVCDTSKIPNIPDEITDDWLSNLGFTSDERILILNKISTDHKMSFCNLVCSDENGADDLQNVYYLLNDVTEKLKL